MQTQKNNIRTAALFAGALYITASALAETSDPHLRQLQKAALSDQSAECMLDEYAKRYNQMKGQDAATADEEAMKWVRSVWKDADPAAVKKSLESEEFRKGAAAYQFRDDAYQAFSAGQAPAASGPVEKFRAAADRAMHNRDLDGLMALCDKTGADKHTVERMREMLKELMDGGITKTSYSLASSGDKQDQTVGNMRYHTPQPIAGYIEFWPRGGNGTFRTFPFTQTGDRCSFTLTTQKMASKRSASA